MAAFLLLEPSSHTSTFFSISQSVVKIICVLVALCATAALAEKPSLVVSKSIETKAPVPNADILVSVRIFNVGSGYVFTKLDGLFSISSGKPTQRDLTRSERQRTVSFFLAVFTFSRNNDCFSSFFT